MLIGLDFEHPRSDLVRTDFEAKTALTRSDPYFATNLPSRRA